MVRQPKTDPQKDVSLFARYLWFYIFYFFCLMMIASFGLIAEA